MGVGDRLFVFVSVSLSPGIHAAFFPGSCAAVFFPDASYSLCRFASSRLIAPHFFPRLRADFSTAAALPFFPRAKCSMLPGFVPPEREQDRMGRKQKNIGRVCMRAGAENDHGSGRNVSNWEQRKWSCDGGALFLPHNFMAP